MIIITIITFILLAATTIQTYITRKELRKHLGKHRRDTEFLRAVNRNLRKGLGIDPDEDFWNKG